MISKLLAGENAVKHDVYLGTDLNAVNNATRDNPLGVLVSQAQEETSYDAGTLEDYSIYYWRVDEVLADETIIQCETWSFITMTDSGSKGRSCFTAETPVWIDGKMIEIAKADSGLNTRITIEEDEIIQLLKHEGTHELFDIVLDSGNSITVANNHYFMAESGLWVSLYDLSAGMNLSTAEGKIKIRSITKRPELFTGKVYNLKIKESHKYMVGIDGLIVRDY